MSGSHQLCTFQVADLTLGIDVTTVQEVLRAQTLTPVPLAPAAVRGLINLRGLIVTAFDIRPVLGLPPCTDSALMNVVLRREHAPVSLLVDSIADVITVDEETFERPPETLAPRAKELIRGAYKLPTGFVLALEVDAALALACRTS